MLAAFDVLARTDVDGDGDADFRGGILKATDGVPHGYTVVRDELQADDRGRRRPARQVAVRRRIPLPPVLSGRPQADYYLGVLKKAGWIPGVDIVSIVDVEFGGERASNHYPETTRTIDVTTAFADRCREVTGRGVMLSGRGVMRDRGIAQSKKFSWDRAADETLAVYESVMR